MSPTSIWKIEKASSGINRAVVVPIILGPLYIRHQPLKDLYVEGQVRVVNGQSPRMPQMTAMS